MAPSLAAPCASLPPAKCPTGYVGQCYVSGVQGRPPSWECAATPATEFWWKYKGWVAFATPIAVGFAVGRAKGHPGMGAGIGAAVSALGLGLVIRFGGYRG